MRETHEEVGVQFPKEVCTLRSKGCLTHATIPLKSASSQPAFLQAFELLFTFKQESTDHGGKFVNNEFDDIYLVCHQPLA